MVTINYESVICFSREKNKVSNVVEVVSFFCWESAVWWLKEHLCSTEYPSHNKFFLTDCSVDSAAVVQIKLTARALSIC